MEDNGISSVTPESSRFQCNSEISMKSDSNFFHHNSEMALLKDALQALHNGRSTGQTSYKEFRSSPFFGDRMDGCTFSGVTLECFGVGNLHFGSLQAQFHFGEDFFLVTLRPLLEPPIRGGGGCVGKNELYSLTRDSGA